MLLWHPCPPNCYPRLSSACCLSLPISMILPTCAHPSISTLPGANGWRALRQLEQIRRDGVFLRVTRHSL